MHKHAHQKVPLLLLVPHICRVDNLHISNTNDGTTHGKTFIWSLEEGFKPLDYETKLMFASLISLSAT